LIGRTAAAAGERVTLYLVQHGEAKPEAEDPERPLTERGRNDVARLAALLARWGVHVPCIQHSGKRRARETAEILATALRPSAGIAAKAGLSPNDPVVPLAAELATLSEDTMLVGHLPHLGRLAALLVTGREEPPVIAFTPGTLVRLERTVQWVLAAVVPSGITAPA
jgi:phosphohistidine phosphatase